MRIEMAHPNIQSAIVCPLTNVVSLLNCSPVMPTSSSLITALAK